MSENRSLESLTDYNGYKDKDTRKFSQKSVKIQEQVGDKNGSDGNENNKMMTRVQKSEFIIPERPNYYKFVTNGLDVKNMMKRFGLQAGFHLPFASKENKVLLDKLEAQQIKVVKLKGEMDESRQAIKELQGHVTQAAINIQFTQTLVDAKTIHRDREMSKDMIEDRVDAKRKSQFVKYKSDLVEYSERNRVRLLDLERRQTRIRALQEKVMADQEKLAIWKQVSSQTETFLQLIIGHKEHDDRHAWELENKQTELGGQNRELRRELDSAAMNTTKLTEQYARLSTEYRKEYKERKEMVMMWSSTLDAMKRKDMDVKQISNEYCEISNKIRKVQLGIKQREKTILEQEWSIQKIEFDQIIMDRKVGELRERILREKELLLTLKNEAVMNRVFVQQTTIATQGLEASVKNSEARVKYFQKKSQNVKDIIQELKRRCDQVSQGKVAVENYLIEMEEELRLEEKNYHRNSREVEKMRKFNWERNNDKTSIEEEIMRTETRIIRTKSNIQILQNKEFDTMEILARKQSQMYRLDLEMSSIESRMMRIVNDAANPEYFKLQAKMVALRDKEHEVANEKDFITKEVHIVAEFNYRYTKEIEITSKKRETLRFMVDNINLEAVRMEGLLTDYINEKKSLTVQMSLQKINLKRLTDAYSQNRGKVLTIAQRRATMEWAVLERKSEINFAMKMLLKQRKELRGHTAKRRLAISNVLNYSEKLKGRFELTTRLMAPQDGVSGEEAMSFQIHKIARERETLTAEIKRWENRLTEADREVQGLTNVVLVMKNFNDSFKQNMAIAHKSSFEAREVDKALKNQKKSIVIRNRCTKKVAALKVKMDNVQKQIDVTKQEAEDMIRNIENKESEASIKRIEHGRLRDRIFKWDNILLKKIQQLKVTQQFLKMSELELKSQLVSLKYQKGLQQLEMALSENPFMKPIVHEFLLNHNMIEDFNNAIIATSSSRASVSAAVSSRSSVFNKSAPSRSVVHSHAARTHPTVHEREFSLASLAHTHSHRFIPPHIQQSHHIHHHSSEVQQSPSLIHKRIGSTVSRLGSKVSSPKHGAGVDH